MNERTSGQTASAVPRNRTIHTELNQNVVLRLLRRSHFACCNCYDVFQWASSSSHIRAIHSHGTPAPSAEPVSVSMYMFACTTFAVSTRSSLLFSFCVHSTHSVAHTHTSVHFDSTYFFFVVRFAQLWFYVRLFVRVRATKHMRLNLMRRVRVHALPLYTLMFENMLRFIFEFVETWRRNSMRYRTTA